MFKYNLAITNIAYEYIPRNRNYQMAFFFVRDSNHMFYCFSESNCVSPAAQCVDNGFLFMHVQDLLTIGDIVILRKGYGGGK